MESAIRAGDVSVAEATRIFLRPIANPMALGFLGLSGATLALAGQELHWIPEHESLEVAAIILISAPALQLVASIFGFLGRDPVAATGMGWLAASWAVIGVVHALSRPGSHSQALGTFLFVAASGVALTALVAAQTKVVPAIVMGVTALRFFVTGLYQLLGVHAIETAGAAIGCLLAVLAVYAAFALELEGLEHRTVLPTLRRSKGALALTPELAPQITKLAAEPGVRNQL